MANDNRRLFNSQGEGDEVLPPDWDQLGRSHIERTDVGKYVYSDEIDLAVNVAMATGRPLLVRGAPGSGQMNQAVYAVLIPHVDELQYSIPAHTNVKVYEIWMRYRMELVTPSGDPIAEWMMTAYGKTPTAFLRSDQAAVNLAAVVALRDAGANFATGFTKVPAVRDWLEQRAINATEVTP